MVATVAGVALHVLGTLALSDVGWVGRGEASSAGQVARAAGLHVRLASPMVLTVHDQGHEQQDGPAASAPPQGVSRIDGMQDLMSQAPPAAGGSATLASTYLSADEIDQGPVPEPGWILNEGVLSEVGRARMRLRLWISESGRIDRIAVIQADPSGDWVDRAIAPLPETRMRPAERDGRPVAASVVVELSADLETLR